MKRILVCPLDWGLGHATRCIPIIRELNRQGAEVVIGASARPLAMLKQEFPTHEFVDFPGYGVLYPSTGNMAVKMLLSIPKVLVGIGREHRKLHEIIAAKKIDGVISDNRYGLWSKTTPCVFITHQIIIKSPLFQDRLYRLNLKYINKYTACWIPDSAGAFNLSGDLSHLSRKYELPENARFIGILSRFSEIKSPSQNSQSSYLYDLLVLLSGPEPQRTIFEKEVLTQLQGTDLRTLVVRGMPESDGKEQPSENVTLIPHLATVEMHKAFMSSAVVLSRPGYSTLMDLAFLNKKAIFVPTPGQTEQEYFAKSYRKRGMFFSASQGKFELKKAMLKVPFFKGFPPNHEPDTLESTITGFLERL